MKKNTYILVGLFILLLVVAFLVLQRPGEQSSSSASAGPMFTIDSTSVDKLEIRTATDSLVFEKRGGEWFVSQPINYKADQAKIGQLIGQVKSIEVKSIVSSKPEKFPVFQVEQSGLHVKVYENGVEKASFVIGKMGTNYTESYARDLNSNDVLLVSGASAYAFNRPVKDWRDKNIFTAPKESIKEVQFQFGDTAFAVVFKDSIWVVGQEKAQQSVVNDLLSSLSNFNADDFVDSVISPKITSTVMCAGVQLRFSFDKTMNKYKVQSSDSPQWFIVEPWKANKILKRKKEII